MYCNVRHNPNKLLANYPIELQQEYAYPIDAEYDFNSDRKRGDVVSKLFKLKEWLTVLDAAEHLSITLGENISEADVLRLALDRHLKLSANFVNNAKVRRTKVVQWEDAEWLLFPMMTPRMDNDLPPEMTAGTAECPPILQSLWDKIPESERKEYRPFLLPINIDGKLLDHDQNVTEISGIFDLPMIGGERLDIEHKFQQLTGGPVVTATCPLEAYIEDDDGVLCQIQGSDIYNEFVSESATTERDLLRNLSNKKISRREVRNLLDKHNQEWESNPRGDIHKINEFDSSGSVGTLPEDIVIVVRTKALRDFERSLNKEPASKEICSPSPGHLNHDPQMQQKANEIAAELKISLKRVPTKEYVAKRLAKEFKMDAVTVARRIRKQWK